MRAGLGGFDIDDLVGAFFAYMGGFRPEDDDGDGDFEEKSSLEWEKIGKLAMAKSRRVPAMDFMYVTIPQSICDILYLYP